MLWECLILNDEIELLLARLHEGDGVVDRWVVVEAKETFSGRAKPLYYAENIDQFTPWADRIIHIVADLSGATDPWAREAAQRDAISEAINAADPDDVVSVTDADELIAATVWPEIERLTETGPVVLPMRQLYYTLCWATPWWGERGRAARRRDIDAVSTFADRKDLPWRLYEAGWHLSCLGGPERVAEKLRSFSHTELSDPSWANTENCARLIRDGLDIHPGRAWQLETVAPQGPGWLLDEGVKRWPWLITGGV